MSDIRVKHKLEDVNDDGLELVLEDFSVLDNKDDVLFNPLISDHHKAKNNQLIRKIVNFI